LKKRRVLQYSLTAVKVKLDLKVLKVNLKHSLQKDPYKNYIDFFRQKEIKVKATLLSILRSLYPE